MILWIAYHPHPLMRIATVCSHRDAVKYPDLDDSSDHDDQYDMSLRYVTSKQLNKHT